jgi:RNA polymerase sigma-70 factor (ECF subfamily)
MTSPDDQRTVERLRAGDASELERVFRTHYGPLCGFLTRYVGAAQAEELVQETFGRLWSDRERLQVHTSLRAYLYASARNRALNQLKRHGIEQRWTEAEALKTPEAIDPEAPEALERAEVSARVRAVIGSLPPRLRETVELRWASQWSHAEIAEAMGISAKGVEANIARAKAALRTALEDLIE